jgi:cytochrome c1
MRLSLLSALTLLVVSIAAALLAGCTGGQAARPYTVANGGYVHRGEQLIVRYRCGSCHTIPGVPNANGVFGPPLTQIASRAYVGGMFPNAPDTLAHWIASPQSMKPKTAMPNLGVTPQQSRDITAYLETLR